MTFESEDVVDKVCEIHFHEINNKMASLPYEKNWALFELKLRGRTGRGRIDLLNRRIDAHSRGEVSHCLS